MDETSRAAQLAKLRAHCAKAPPAVLFDEPGALLMDVSSGKTLPLDLAALEKVEDRINAETKNPYGDGRQLALSEVGIAFPPDLTNTGPLPELPEVVCFRDYATLMARLKHDLYGHQDREPTRETVKLLMMCIAIVDGARAQRFEIGREEKELEWHLKELEKRAPVPGNPG
jgi:hypothetical protein